MAESSSSLVAALGPALIGVVAGAVGAGGFAIWLGDRIWPENRPPIAEIEVTPDSGPAPLSATLNGSGSSDPDGGQLKIIWSVGTEQLESGELVQLIEFSQPGTHVVTIEVRDSSGRIDRASKTVTVTDAFDLQAHLLRVDEIQRVIQRGEFSLAIDLADQGIDNCQVAPPERCAELHFQKARALIRNGNLPNARQALAEATTLQPDTLEYTVMFSEVLINLNEYDAAIAELTRFNTSYPTVWNTRYYLALAQALKRDYAQAQSGLEAVSKNSIRYAHRAEFGYVLTSLLAKPGEIRDHAQRVRKAVCGDPALAALDEVNADSTEVDLLCMKKLASDYLDEADSTWLQDTMEEGPCS